FHRMFHIDPARLAGLLLCLLLLLTMQVGAEDSNNLEVTPPQTSMPAASAASESAQTGSEQAAQDAETAKQVTEEVTRTLEQEFSRAFDDKSMAGLALLIPLFAILFIFGGPIILVIV